MKIFWDFAESIQPAEGRGPRHYGWTTNKESHYIPDLLPGPVEPDNLCSDAETPEQTTQQSDDVEDPAGDIDNDSEFDSKLSDD